MLKSRPVSQGTYWPVIAFALAAALLVGDGGLQCGLYSVGRADENTKSEPTREADKQASAARLAVMRSRAQSLTAEAESENGSAKVEIIESPLLRYANLAAAIVTDDATVWGWGREGRPRILASVEAVGCEVVSLSAQPVSLTGKSGLKWSPKTSEIKWQPVPKAPRPGDSATTRARQMKEIFARFTAKGHYTDTSGTMELRPLVRHLHRYADPKEGIVDGAIFAFTAGTNPEVILLLECRQSNQDQAAEWYYGCTRLSAGALEARLDGKIAWDCPAIVAWKNTEPYFSTPFGKEDFDSKTDVPQPPAN